jgi:hypothetical protein
VDVWVATAKCAVHIPMPVTLLSLQLDPSFASPYPGPIVPFVGRESVVMLRT